MGSLTVQISQPCHERWSEMKPAERGRFCTSCQKTVVDYTTFSDQELVKLLSKPLETSCGRFRDGQLNRQLMLSSPATSLWRQWIGMLTMGLLSWQTARAQLNHAGKPLSATPAKPDYTLAALPIRAAIGGSFSTVVLTGKVMLVDSGKNLVPAAWATVFVSRPGGNWQTQTDNTGAFAISVSIPMDVTPLTVTAFALGHIHHKITVEAAPSVTSIALDRLILAEQPSPLIITGGGLTIIKTPSRWQKLKRKLFH